MVGTIISPIKMIRILIRRGGAPSGAAAFITFFDNKKLKRDVCF